jgi:mannose-6-phosphate isomerase-like protein (cupin superfamily)
MRPYRVNAMEIPAETRLPAEDGWIDMRVQFLLGTHTGAQGLVLGRTILPPGARHEKHRHPNCDEFLFVARGRGVIYTDEGEEPSGENDVVFTPAGHWHGFNNTSEEEVLLLWGWRGAGSLEEAGYELAPDAH